jgi:hypothetical protein
MNGNTCTSYFPWYNQSAHEKKGMAATLKAFFNKLGRQEQTERSF